MTRSLRETYRERINRRARKLADKLWYPVDPDPSGGWWFEGVLYTDPAKLKAAWRAKAKAAQK